MARDKASLPWEGSTLLERTVQQLGRLSEDVIVVGRQSAPDGAYAVTDEEPGLGPVGGLLTGLRRARFPLSLVVACDHPFLDATALLALVDHVGDFDAVVPVIGGREQPLHAVYRRNCAAVIERYVRSGGRSLRGLLPHLSVCRVEEAALAAVDPEFRSFWNVNTPEDWASVADGDPRQRVNRGRIE